jgi:hypothetical protein
MKKFAALALAGFILMGAAFLAPRPSFGHDVEGCYLDYQKCREFAFMLDDSWFKTMLALTVCDLMLGKCLFTI